VTTFPIFAIVVVFIGVCAVVDLRTRRIPNVLSGSAALAGVILNTFYFGVPGSLASLTGLAATIAVLLLPFALGGIGGGDVKMMAALGALLGPRLALAGMGAGMVLGGAVMAAYLVRSCRLREKLRAIRVMLTSAVLTGSLAPLKVDAADPQAVSLPYSLPLGAGTLAVLMLARPLGLL
jgi:prepilin peptidase CpaA